MMFKQPMALIIVPVGLIGIALSFPLQIMSLYGHTFSEGAAILAKITWLNWLTMSFCLVNALLIFRGSAHVKWSLPLMFMVVIFNNLVVSYVGTDFSFGETLLASLGFLLFHSLLLTPDARRVLVNSKKQWWKNAKRISIALPVAVKPHYGSEFTATTFNLSQTGLFIPFDSQVFKEAQASTLRPGKKITLRLTLDQLRSIRCEGQVVRTTLAQGEYPSGIGLQFSEMKWVDRRRLTHFLNHA